MPLRRCHALTDRAVADRDAGARVTKSTASIRPIATGTTTTTSTTTVVRVPARD